MRIIELAIQALNTVAALVVAFGLANVALVAFLAGQGGPMVLATFGGLVFSGLALANFRLFLYFTKKG